MGAGSGDGACDLVTNQYFLSGQVNYGLSLNILGWVGSQVDGSCYAGSIHLTLFIEIKKEEEVHMNDEVVGVSQDLNNLGGSAIIVTLFMTLA